MHQHRQDHRHSHNPCQYSHAKVVSTFYSASSCIIIIVTIITHYNNIPVIIFVFRLFIFTCTFILLIFSLIVVMIHAHLVPSSCLHGMLFLSEGHAGLTVLLRRICRLPICRGNSWFSPWHWGLGDNHVVSGAWGVCPAPSCMP